MYILQWYARKKSGDEMAASLKSALKSIKNKTATEIRELMAAKQSDYSAKQLSNIECNAQREPGAFFYRWST